MGMAGFLDNRSISEARDECDGVLMLSVFG